MEKEQMDPMEEEEEEEDQAQWQEKKESSSSSKWVALNNLLESHREVQSTVEAGTR